MFILDFYVDIKIERERKEGGRETMRERERKEGGIQ